MTQTSTAVTVLEGLEAGLPDAAVRVDADIVAAYSMDRATYCPVGKALALVHARSTADVQQVMTITGEHGVGLLKMELLEQEIGPLALDVHRRIKPSLDPLGILNLGKIYDLSADLSDWR